MNTILAAANTPLFLMILFWILLILWAIGAFVSTNPNVVRGSKIVEVILFAILGYAVFGFN